MRAITKPCCSKPTNQANLHLPALWRNKTVGLIFFNPSLRASQLGEGGLQSISAGLG
jgi:hypothetical protein